MLNKNEIIAWFLIVNVKYFVSSQKNQKPNILIIIADDLGFNDVGFHGSNQIPTPNIDALAYHGIILNRHYVQSLCTPSRAALLSGKYPINIGMQSLVIMPEEPWGMSLDEKLLPEYLQENGYDTHLIGKWHLGFYRKAYTPLKRGFKSFFGYYGAALDYFNHGWPMEMEPYTFGHDLRINETNFYPSNKSYATNLFTNAAIRLIHNHNKNTPLFLELAHVAPHAGPDDDPFQVPMDVLHEFKYIKNKQRRAYAGMVSILDKSVGKIVKALKQNEMLDNSIILFLSDNGGASVGPTFNQGSNSPLRGQKHSPWEGGSRSVAAIWSPLLKQQQRVSNQLIHITDWLPTLLAAANISLSTINNTIDGINMWDALSNNNGTNPRTELVINIDSTENNRYSAIIKESYKYINGSTSNGLYDQWLGGINNNEWHPLSLVYSNWILKSVTGIALSSTTNQSLPSKIIRNLRKEATVNCGGRQSDDNNNQLCDPLKNPCLFNLIEDPCEMNNLANVEQEKLFELSKLVGKYSANAVPPRNQPIDIRCNPSNFNNTWTWWWDELGIIDT